jgi:16S rRNA G966 N2-methylase RsmD
MIIDQSRQVIEHISAQMAIFVPDEADYSLHCGDALAWMRQANPEVSYDIVFLDPPFAEELLSTTCQLLQERCLLAEGALVYIESEEAITAESLPSSWVLHRRKRAGNVHYGLCMTR